MGRSFKENEPSPLFMKMVDLKLFAVNLLEFESVFLEKFG